MSLVITRTDPNPAGPSNKSTPSLSLYFKNGGRGVVIYGVNDKVMYIPNDDYTKLPLLKITISYWNIWTQDLMNNPKVFKPTNKNVGKWGDFSYVR